MKKKGTIILLCLLGYSGANGQHYQFSQFYAAPIYLNPAFAGAHVCSRFTMNYRSQWTGIPGAFTTYQAAYDHYFRRTKTGLGLQLFQDRAGLGNLTTTMISGLYSYELRVNKKLAMRGGVSAGSVQRKFDEGKFIFGDQIENGESGTTAEQLQLAGTRYFDIGAGILVYGKSMWFGLATSHLNRPNQSLLNGISPLPAETKFHAGYKLPIESFESRGKTDDHYVQFAANYKKQAKFNQVDVGVYYNKNLFVAGVWYRGIPVFRPEASYENNDAVIFLVGLAVQRFKIGYSYDMTLSSLTNAISRGTNEFSMTYQFCQGKTRGKRRKLVLISCPKF